MKNNPKILLIGNIKEDSAVSMKIYASYLQELFPNSKLLEPSCGKLKFQIYKNFIYPFRIPKGYDLYHILDHSYSYLVKLIPSEKLIVTCHDLIPLKFPKFLSLKSRISFRYYISGLKKARIIISPSKSTKNDLMKLLKISFKRIRVIAPIHINPTVFRKLNKKKLNKKYSLENKFILLGIGSAFYKNTLLILKALKKLIIDYPEILFLKVGNFSKQEIDYIKKNNLTKHVLQKKGLSQQELVEVYNLSDVLVFPSLYEGFGIPPLEAMACKVPVITSNVSSLPEVVGDSALKINPCSVEELISTILGIKNNSSLRTSLIKKGEKNLKRFTKEIQKKQLNEVYQEILKK